MPAWLVFLDAVGVAALAGLGEAPKELLLRADRPRRAPLEAMCDRCLGNCGIERGNGLAGTGQVDRAHPGHARGEPEPLMALQALDVEHLPAFGYRQVNRLAGLGAQRLQQRECEPAELAAAGDY